jgi:hypothetical protein
MGEEKRYRPVRPRVIIREFHWRPLDGLSRNSAGTRFDRATGHETRVHF